MKIGPVAQAQAIVMGIRMTRYQKRAIWIASVLVVVLTALFVINAWWGSLPPPRPEGVSPTAAYYGGLARPFAYPKRGEWVNCWFDLQKSADICRNISFDGILKFEGVYLPYSKQAAIPESELLIDSKIMNQAQEQVIVNASPQESADPGVQMVPLIYLRNGSVLIPAKAYEQASKRLKELQEVHSPYAPRQR